MKKVKREEILPNEVYAERRTEFRSEVLSLKTSRRVHVGEYLTFLFETTDTIRYQIQEMLRVEGRSSVEDIDHELKTYNELLGETGELGCTLLIEIDDVLQRDLVLRKWRQLPRHIYLQLDNGERAMAIYDERQVGEERLSAVQYLKFDCGASVPVGIGLNQPGMEIDVPFSPEQKQALTLDLA